MVGIVLLLIVLALGFGGIGLLVEGLLWLLAISAVLLIVGAIAGIRLKNKVRDRFAN